MAVKLGEKILKDIYLGDKRIVKAYFGEKLVFEADKPIFVEWIESTGTQYIDTEYKLTSDIVEYGIEFYGRQPDRASLFGTQWLDTQYSGIPYSSNLLFYVGNSIGTIDTSYTVPEAQWNTYTAIIADNTVITTLNGEKKTRVYNGSLYKGASIYLFANNKANHPTIQHTSIKLKYYYIKDNGVLVRYLRPCLHPKTFEACMYDTVTHKYFYNKGTGNFIPAPRFVEYLESDSTAYIDTGISGGNDNLSLNMTFYVDKFFTYGGIFGNYVDENTNAFRVICSESVNKLYFNANTRCANASSISVANNFYGSNHTLRLEKTKLTIDDISVGVANYSGTENNTNIALFNRSITNPFGANNIRDIGLRIYSCQMNNGDVMIRDFRPCLRGNTPCMYDMVTGKYYYNQGTGEFTAGGLV